MSERTDQLREDVRFRVLRQLEIQPAMNQRQIAAALGVSLGGVNYCINALVKKGHIKINNFRKSDSKIGYMYVLTPNGAMEKMALAHRFLSRKMFEYELLRSEIEAVKNEFDALNDTAES